MTEHPLDFLGLTRQAFNFDLMLLCGNIRCGNDSLTCFSIVCVRCRDVGQYGMGIFHQRGDGEGDKLDQNVL